MPRLPQPGADNGTWGDILNEYLSQTHGLDGSLKDNIITEDKLSSAVQTKLNQIAPVTSVASKTGAVTLVKADVGLSNVDNTSDATKNSAATTLTNKTISGSSNTLSNIPQSAVTNLTTALAGKVDILARVVTVAAPTGNATTDTAAIQAAHDALPTEGGDILLQGGTYGLTAGGVAFSKPVRLRGVGAWGDPTHFGVTWLSCNSSTATAITISGGGCTLDGFMLTNESAVTASSGWGIRLTNTENSYIHRVWVFNFYDNLRFDSGALWTVDHCLFNAPVRYGLFAANPAHPDSGDNKIINTVFDASGTARTSAAAAIRWESGGGLRISHCKVNGTPGSIEFVTGIDIAVANSVVTSDIYIQDNSIENISDTGVKLSRPGNGTVSLIQIQNNQFQTVDTACIDIGIGYDAVLVSGNIATGAASGVIVRDFAGPTVHIGENVWNGVTTPVVLEGGQYGDTRVARQTRSGDGYLFSDASDYAAVDNSHQRAIDWTSGWGTPHALWTLWVSDYSGGVIQATVTGTHTGVSGFAVTRRVAYVVGAGTITLTDIEDETYGSLGVLLSFDVSVNNVITLKLATNNSASIVGGRASIDTQGRLTSMKIGV